MQGLIKYIWDLGVLVCKAPGCCGLPFKAGWEVIKGWPVFRTSFDLMMDAIIGEWTRLLILNCILLGNIRTDPCRHLLYN